MENELVKNSIEDMYKRQRQERKDLQSRIQALKKTATKGDKKKKKEVAETIAQLELEIDQKHEAELQNYCSPVEDDAIAHHVATNCEATENEIETEKDFESAANKVSRAQKRRNRKQTADKEREKRIADQEEVNKEGPRLMEMNTIKSILQTEGLQIHSIPADGNCLYCAINHQLEVTGRTSLSVSKLRKLTATFIRDNKEEFLPFMYNEDDNIIDDVGFEKYCKDIANTKLWGGHVELTALSNILQCPIKVIQASGPSTLQGEEFLGPPLILTYHKHLYRLGEHYNSTIKIIQSDEMNENENFQEN